MILGDSDLFANSAETYIVGAMGVFVERRYLFLGTIY